MNLDLTQVPRGHLHEVIGVLAPFFRKAAQWTLGKNDADGIAAMLFHPNVQTWVVFDPATQDIHGYLTTEVQQHATGARHLVVLNCGGRDGSLDSCVDKVFTVFEQYARDCGCTGLEIIGRPAWWKFIKERGYEQPQRQYFKSLGDA